VGLLHSYLIDDLVLPGNVSELHGRIFVSTMDSNVPGLSSAEWSLLLSEV
jgi:hypothetical protein